MSETSSDTSVTPRTMFFLLCLVPVNIMYTNIALDMSHIYYQRFLFWLGFCLPRYKRGTDVIFTTLSFSSPSSLSSSSPTDTSMTSVGLLLSLWFWPCSWDSPCDHNNWKPWEIYSQYLQLLFCDITLAIYLSGSNSECRSQVLICRCILMLNYQKTKNTICYSNTFV